MVNSAPTSSYAPKKEPFTIKILTQQEDDEVLQFLQQHFFSDEPLNKCLDRARNEKLVSNDRGNKYICNIKEGFSLMAVTSSNEIIGVAINSSLQANADVQRSTPENHPNSVQIVKLINSLEEQMTGLVKLQNANEKEMSVKVLSVHPAWRNKGVGYALLERAKETAKQNGFNQIRGICTSAYSARLFEKLGFRCVYAMKYEDYKEDGRVIFKPDSPHTHIKVMILRF